MKTNNFIDTTSDEYYINPYNFFFKDTNYNKEKFVSKPETNENLNFIIKTLTSVILNNDDLVITDFNANSTNSPKSTNKKNNIDEFIVFKLVANNDIEGLKKMLDKEYAINVNIQDKDGDTALHIAIFLSNFEACEILITHNANIFIRDKWGQTPLHRLCFALENKNIIKIIQLINNEQKKYQVNKIDIFNCVDKFNNTSLHLVIKYILKNNLKLDKNILSIVNELISLTDINIVNNDGLSGNDLINMLDLSRTY